MKNDVFEKAIEFEHDARKQLLITRMICESIDLNGYEDGFETIYRQSGSPSCTQDPKLDTFKSTIEMEGQGLFRFSILPLSAMRPLSRIQLRRLPEACEESDVLSRVDRRQLAVAIRLVQRGG